MNRRPNLGSPRDDTRRDGRYDHYRQRHVKKGDPCDVCGSTDTRVKTVEDGYKPLCDEHYDMFGPQ